MAIRGELVTFASRTFWLIVARQDSIKRFAKCIGFTIQRKHQKLRDALNLIRSRDQKSSH